MSLAEESSKPDMELGFLDVGSASLFSDESQVEDEASPNSPTAETKDSSAVSVRRKSKSPKGSPPFANALNRLSCQIKKPPRRKTSPGCWSPRKKGDSYLSRKIKLLQEAGGMNDSLDETLGHANPHYCRVEREKIAAKEAAMKVMNARKAAMVEASWCRILRAARIPTKEAEALLVKAEEEVSEAVQAAMANGVMMYETPDRPWKQFEISKKGSMATTTTTHTVKASFETAFEVDRQVAAAVKTAFVRLANCSSFDTDEFKELLRKISENPDNNQEEISESDSGSSEFELGDKDDDDDDDNGSSKRRIEKKLCPQKFNGTMLVDMMVERLKCLKEEELASLATIVATCGLNAALARTETHGRTQDYSVSSRASAKQRQAESELPSLDKFLVKKMTKLEREVQESRNAKRAESNKSDQKPASADEVPSLDKFLVKKLTRLEREVLEARNARKAEVSNNRNQDMGRVKKHGKSCWNQDTEVVPSLDQCLVKHVSRLEKEVQEVNNNNNNNRRRRDEQVIDKENINSNEKGVKTKLDDANNENGGAGLDQILVERQPKLEREKTISQQQQRDDGVTYSSLAARRKEREREMLEMWGGVGLGAMRPQVSRLEREKAAWRKAEEEERKALLPEQ